MHKRTHLESLAAACLAAAIAGQAAAQDQSADAAEELTTIPVPGDQASAAPAETRAAPRGNALVEEIIVTAQKREENLQDVPVSVQAFGSDQLNVLGAFEAADLPRITPGLVSTAQFGFVSTYIRGVGTDAFILADPSVANYVDGVYNPTPIGSLQDFGVVERIEVLKGPQGTLFGRNAVGGAIHVITKPLSLEQPETVVQTIYGSYNNLRTRISTSIPLSDSLAIGLSGLRNSSETYLHDASIAGKPLPDSLEKGYRAKVRWAPSDSSELDLSTYYVTADSAGSFFPNTEPSPLGRLASVQPQDAREGAQNEGGTNSSRTRIHAATFKLETSWLDLKLIGSDQHTEAVTGLDFDGSPSKIAFFEVSPYVSDSQTAELQLISNDSTWGSDWSRWIVGAYYFTGRQGYQRGALSVLETQLGPAAELLGLPLPQSLIDILPGPNGQIGFTGLLDTDSVSAFAQATVDFTDWFALTLGGRYQDEERRLVKSDAGLELSGGGRALIPGQNYSCADDPQWCNTTKGFYPKVSLDFRPWDQTLIYASWQEAVKSSTINAVNIIDAPDIVKPEELSAYEIGIKTQLLDGLITFNAAAFQYDTDNLQTQFVSLFAGGVITFENAQKARSRGFEFDSTTVLLPDHIDNLVMTLGGTFLDAKYRKFEGAAGFTGPLGVFTNNNDFSGNRIVRSPKFTGTAGLFKTFTTSFGAIDAGVDYYHNSGFYYLAQNSDSAKEGAYGVLGARVSVTYAPWDLQVALFGRNISGTDYNNARFVEDLGTLDSAAPLATYGMQVTWKF